MKEQREMCLLALGYEGVNEKIVKILHNTWSYRTRMELIYTTDDVSTANEEEVTQVDVPDAEFQVVTDLAADGTVERGWLGVNIQPLDSDLAESFGHSTRHGVLVSGVLDGTPAANAGLEPGDIIVSIDGRRTDTPASLARTIAQSAPEDTIALELVRDGRTVVKTAVLATRPSDPSATTGSKDEAEPAAPARLGLELAPLDDELRAQAGLQAESGIFVRGVEADGPAAAAGIEPGDAILRIGDRTVDSVASFKEALDEIPEDRSIRLLVERDGTTRFMLVRPRD